MKETAQGRVAPAFELPDIHGAPVSFRPEAPGSKVLAFYKNSCPTCQYAMPYFDRLHKIFGPLGAQVYGISQDSIDEAARFAGEFDLRMPVLTDAHPHPVSREYKLMNVPTLLVIDDQATIRLWSPAFVKSDVEEAARLLAQVWGTGIPTVFAPGEDVLEMKPG